MWAMEMAFWSAIGMIAYAYVGYPAVLAAVARVRAREPLRANITPRVSVIVAAYDEAPAIGARIENLLAMDHPASRLEIIVASDGSTDRTAEIAGRYAGRGVRVLRLPRRGKIPALRAAVAAATGEILVFTDANIRFARDAVRQIVRPFADPEVGGVAGDTRYEMPPDGESTARGEGLYWRYDTWLKSMESRTGSVVAAHGGIYAIRRELFDPLPETSVTDDFAISTGVIARGRRLVFEPRAVAYEVAIGTADREFARKVRLITRAWRSIGLRRGLLNPFRYGFYSVVLLSHKVLRRLVPVALVTMLAASATLAPAGGVYLAAAAGQALFYLAAAVGYAARGHRSGRAGALYIPLYYCLANAAALVALVAALRGQRIELWQPQRHTVGARR